MSDGQGTYLLAGVVGFAVFVLFSYYFTRWVFSIKRQLWNEKAMINLLIKIARKQGVSEDELELIEKRNNDPDADLS